MLNFKISLLAKIDLLKITLNSCGFKIYRFYTTFIDCKNTFHVLLLMLMNIFCPFKQKVNSPLNTGNLTGLLAIFFDMQNFLRLSVVIQIWIFRPLLVLKIWNIYPLQAKTEIIIINKK